MPIQIRRDPAATWSATNPTPAAGQPCYETDSKKLKIGDGVTAYNSLSYVTAAATVADGDKGEISVVGGSWTIDNNVVTLAKMQDIATDRLLGRVTAGSGDPEEILITDYIQSILDDPDAATARGTLGLGSLATQNGTFSGTHSGNSSGTNTGDQTSIVGISGTLGQFNTACSDADFASGGGVCTGSSSGTNTGDQTGLTGMSFTLAQLNAAVSDADVQPLDADLTTIAGLTPTTDSFMQAKSSAWSVRSIAQVKTDLGLTGTNSGDQTSIVGISGTLAQFNTAISDADIMPTSGGTFSGNVSVPDEAYGGTWDGSLQVPTKNAVYDKIQTLGAGGGMTVGSAVTGGINGTVLYKDASGNLASDSDFTFNGSQVGIGAIGGAFNAALDILSPAPMCTIKLRGTAQADASSGSGTNPATFIDAIGPAGQAITGTTANSSASSGGPIIMTAGIGGAATGIPASGFTRGGPGAAVTFTAGAGGTASGVSGDCRGGAGGAATLRSGAGGNSSGTGAAGAGGTVVLTAGTGGSGATAGAGGAITLTGGTGGGSGSGGVGGAITILGGTGGFSTPSLGVGGAISIQGGAGSATGGEGRPAAAGGQTTILGGAGGFAGGTTDTTGAGGLLYLDAGPRGVSGGAALGVHGNINFGTVNAVNINIGNASSIITCAADLLVPDEAYGAGWDGSLEVPTKNALYDKIQTLGAGGGMTVGSAVTGGTNNTVLYKDSSGNLASDVDFFFDGSKVGIGQPSPTASLEVLSPVTTITFKLAGTAAAPVSSGNGTAALATVDIVGAAGGAASSTTDGSGGGTGANISIVAGAGGAHSGIPVSTFTRGGVGGAITITAGAGGAGTAASSLNQGRGGGSVTITGGASGACTAGPTVAAGGASLRGGTGGAGATAGGAGGTALVQGGAGGASSGGSGGAGGSGSVSGGTGSSGTTTNGAGGGVQVLGGNGGTANASALVGGVGGNASCAAGSGGGAFAAGQTAGNGGTLTIDAGPAGGASGGGTAGVNGNLNLGTTNALNVNIGNASSIITCNADLRVPDEAYGAGWDGSLEVPTKNAVYDKIQTVVAGGGGGVTVGNPVTGGVNNTLLFVDGSGNVGSDSAVVWNNVTEKLVVTSLADDVANTGAFKFEFAGLGTPGYTTGMVIQGNAYYNIQLLLKNAAYGTNCSFATANVGGCYIGGNAPALFNFGTSGASVFAINLSTGATAEPVAKVTTGYAAQRGIEVKLAATPTANAIEVNSSAGSGGDLFRVDAAGAVAITKPAAGANYQSFYGSGGTGWHISLGSETINHFYIGGPTITTHYFWRANWNDTALPANTFKSASDGVGQIVMGVHAPSGQTADLQRWTVNNVTLSKVKASGAVEVPDEAYGAGWDGSLEVPTKNALYDKIQTLGGGGGMSIGGAVSGGTSTRVPYIDASGNLAQSANLTYDPTVSSAGSFAAAGFQTYAGSITNFLGGAGIYIQHSGNGIEFLGPSGAHRALFLGSQFSTTGNISYSMLATFVGLTIKLAASQSANAFEINSTAGSGGDVFKVEADGDVVIPDGKTYVAGTMPMASEAMAAAMAIALG